MSNKIGQIKKLASKAIFTDLVIGEGTEAVTIKMQTSMNEELRKKIGFEMLDLIGEFKEELENADPESGIGETMFFLLLMQTVLDLDKIETKNEKIEMLTTLIQLGVVDQMLSKLSPSFIEAVSETMNQVSEIFEQQLRKEADKNGLQ